MKTRNDRQPRNIKTLIVVALIAVGCIPAILVAGISLYMQSAGMKEEVVERLASLREARQNAVENWFETIRGQVETFSDNPAVIAGMRDMPEAFFAMDEVAITVAPPSIEDMRQAVAAYYQRQFATTYVERNDGESVGVEQLWRPLSDQTIRAQYHYIAANPEPLGEKHVMTVVDGDLADGSYHRLHADLHPSVRHFLEEFEYYDIFLVEPEGGHIVYSVFKELDYGTSLLDGPYADSNFADAFRLAREAGVRGQRDAQFLVDFEPYLPSYRDPASFIASPIFEGERFLGVAIFQMPIGRLTAMMSRTAGLGQSGEAYLVGPDHLPRSNVDAREDTVAGGLYGGSAVRSFAGSFHHPDEGRIESAAVDRALEGESGAAVLTNYAGADVVSAYAPLDIMGNAWALIVEMGEEEAMASVRQQLWVSSAIIAVSLVAVILLSLFIARGLGTSLNRMIARLGATSRRLGDLSHQLTDDGGKSLERANTVASAAEQISTNVDSVASASEEMSVNIASVSSTAQQMSAQTNDVATSIAELSKAISEVARHASEGSRIADEASSQSASASETMHSLSEAAGQIGQVTELIKKIAEQTNLLALNATIEAASAGEAGKGFAVVAGEIKELANQSAKAAEDIAHRIAEVQSNTGRASEVIGSVTETIQRLNESAASIAANVDEQRATMETVSANVQEVTKGVASTAASIAEINSGAEDVSRNAGELREAVQAVAESIGEVNSLVSTGQRSVEDVGRAVADLQVVADDMRGMVGQRDRGEVAARESVPATSAGHASGSHARVAINPLKTRQA